MYPKIAFQFLLSYPPSQKEHIFNCTVRLNLSTVGRKVVFVPPKRPELCAVINVPLRKLPAPSWVRYEQHLFAPS